jgi:hypothetical protein
LNSLQAYRLALMGCVDIAVTFGRRFRMGLLVLAAQFCAAVQREAEELIRQSVEIQARAAPATVGGRFDIEHIKPACKSQATGWKHLGRPCRLNPPSPDTGQ